jgi:AraC-like DNA-binding protein
MKATASHGAARFSRDVHCWTDWSDAVNDFYGNCLLAGDRHENYAAHYSGCIDSRTIDTLTVTDLICDPVEGRRAEVAPRAASTFSIQLIESGQKRFVNDGFSVLATTGDVLINLGGWRCDFEVQERSHEITLTMPLDRLRAWMPGNLQRRRYKLDANSPGAELMASIVRSVSSTVLSGALTNGFALTEGLIGVAVASITNEIVPQPPRSILLAEITSYIAEHLSDPDLSIPQIAAHKRISVRYLHALFGETGMTLQQYIIRERLRRSSRDLVNPCMSSRSITDIAYDSGFRNIAHFSKRFRDEFGLSPSGYRDAPRYVVN